LEVLIVGIMQGNRRDSLLHSQDYRERISNALWRIDQSVEIIDPSKTNPSGLAYTRARSQQKFFLSIVK
jgi:hypothetical protein